MTRGGAGRIAERVGAVLLAGLVFSLNLPDIPTGPTRWSPREQEFWVAAGYVAVFAGLCAAVWIGQTRSPAWRVIGWVGLMAGFMLKVM